MIVKKFYHEFSSDVDCVPPVADDFVGDELGFAFAQAGYAHNPHLLADVLEGFLGSSLWVHRFLAAGNVSLGEVQRERLKVDVRKVVRAAAVFMEPGSEVARMPEEWVSELFSVRRINFKASAIRWDVAEGDAGFCQGWFSDFMYFRYPELFPWGFVPVTFATGKPKPALRVW